jgi:hypothetical protein
MVKNTSHHRLFSGNRSPGQFQLERTMVRK